MKKIIITAIVILSVLSCQQIKKANCKSWDEVNRCTNEILEKIKQENIFMDKIGWENLNPEQNAIYKHNLDLSIDIIDIRVKYIGK